MHGQFNKGNCAVSYIYIYIYIYIYAAAMLRVSLSFGLLAYLEAGGDSWICGREQVEAVGRPTFKGNGAPN